MRHFGTGMLALFLAALPAVAQEPWDTSFHLLAMRASGAKDAVIAQDQGLGLSIQGAYPLTLRSFLVFDGGYRYFSTTSTYRSASETNDNKADGYYGGLYYRHELFTPGFHLQAGVRVSQMRAMQTDRFGSGTSLDHDKGPKATSVTPALGFGYRFTEKYSAGVTLGSLDLKRLDGVTKKVSTLDVALGIHFGK